MSVKSLKRNHAVHGLGWRIFLSGCIANPCAQTTADHRPGADPKMDEKLPSFSNRSLVDDQQVFGHKGSAMRPDKKIPATRNRYASVLPSSSRHRVCSCDEVNSTWMLLSRSICRFSTSQSVSQEITLRANVAARWSATESCWEYFDRRSFSLSGNVHSLTTTSSSIRPNLTPIIPTPGSTVDMSLKKHSGQPFADYLASMRP